MHVFLQKDVTCASLGNCANGVVDGSVRKKTSNLLGWPGGSTLPSNGKSEKRQLQNPI